MGMVRYGRASSWRRWLVVRKGEAKTGSVERSRMVSLMRLKSMAKLHALERMLEAALNLEERSIPSLTSTVRGDVAAAWKQRPPPALS